MEYSEDDKNWPEPDRIGTQELEIVSGSDHISFGVSIFIYLTIGLFAIFIPPAFLFTTTFTL